MKLKIAIVAALTFAASVVRAGTVADQVDYEYLEANAERITSPIDGGEYYKVDDMLFQIPEKNFGGAYTTQWEPWPNGIVYYMFKDPSILYPVPEIDDSKKSIFLSACNEWAQNSGLTFIEGISTQGNYLIPYCGSDNSSGVGMGIGRHTISICTWSKGIVAHEIGHTLGLIHEHQRSDRNAYVTAMYENISESNRGEFSISNENIIATNYDFLSLMHYNKGAFSMNGKDTINCNIGYEIYQDDIGQHCMVSSLDRIAISKLYGGTATTCSIAVSVNDATLGSVRGGPVDVKDFDASHMTLVNPGVPITLRAVAPTMGDGEFESWEISEADCADASTATIVITPRGDCSVKANFINKVPRHTVTFTAGEGGTIQGETTQIVKEKSSTTEVTAIPNEGLQFTGWTGSVNSKLNPLTINDVTNDMTIKAEFAATELKVTDGMTLTFIATVALGGTDTAFSPKQTPILIGVKGVSLKVLSNTGTTMVVEMKTAPTAGSYKLSLKCGSSVVSTAYTVKVMAPDITNAVRSGGTSINVSGGWFGKKPTFTVNGKRAKATIRSGADGTCEATVIPPKNVTNPNQVTIKNKSGTDTANIE